VREVCTPHSDLDLGIVVIISDLKWRNKTQSVEDDFLRNFLLLSWFCKSSTWQHNVTHSYRATMEPCCYIGFHEGYHAVWLSRKSCRLTHGCDRSSDINLCFFHLRITSPFNSDVKSSRTSWPRGQNFVLGLEHLSSACPWTFCFGLVIMCVTGNHCEFATLHWLSTKVIYILALWVIDINLFKFTFTVVFNYLGVDEVT